MSPTDGLINSPKPKPPTPKPSPKAFKWPTSNAENVKAFAAALQVLLPKNGMAHPDLAKKLWGEGPNNVARNIGKAREWVRGSGILANANEAAYVAQVLGVSMQQLIEHKHKFNAEALPIRIVKPRSEWKTSPKGKDHTNGASGDNRWVRPNGVAAPTLKLETSKKHPTLLSLELKGDLPSDIAMAVMAMVSSKAADE